MVEVILPLGSGLQLLQLDTGGVLPVRHHGLAGVGAGGGEPGGGRSLSQAVKGGRGWVNAFG